VIAVMDFMPGYCPNCGAELAMNQSLYAHYDWAAGASHRCPKECGIHFARADHEEVLKAADASNSDLRMYV